MKKKLFIVAAVVIIVIAAVMFLPKSAEAPATPTPSTGTTASETGKKQTGALPGTYVDYSETAIDTAQGDIYLFFHAPWCSQCRSIEAGINEDGVPSDVTVIKVDYDSNQELRQKYGVTLQTTFVKIDAAGQLQSKFVAYDDPYFSSVVRDYISK